MLRVELPPTLVFLMPKGVALCGNDASTFLQLVLPLQLLARSVCALRAADDDDDATDGAIFAAKCWVFALARTRSASEDMEAKIRKITDVFGLSADPEANDAPSFPELLKSIADLQRLSTVSRDDLDVQTVSEAPVTIGEVQQVVMSLHPLSQVLLSDRCYLWSRAIALFLKVPFASSSSRWMRGESTVKST